MSLPPRYPIVFTVFTVYHKRGEYDIEVYQGEDALRAAAEEFVGQFEEPNDYFPSMENFRQLSFAKVCSVMLEMGPKIIANRDGHGWVSIMRGGTAL